MSDINMSLKKGHIISILGPNGAGKSTLLKTISREIKSLSGSISYDQDITDDFYKNTAVLSTERIDSGMKTVYDIVSHGRIPYTGRLGSLDESDREVIDSVCRETQTGDLSDRFFAELSDGQRQRVLIARAFAQTPELMIMDEPMSYLDIRYKLNLLHLLRHKADEGMTIIMSVHEAELARLVSDELILMNHGFEYGTVDDEFTRDKISELYDITDSEYDMLYHTDSKL